MLRYSTYFFQLAGLDTSRSFYLGVAVIACGVAGNIASWFVVDSYGRRKCSVGGMVALTALLLLIGIMDAIPTGPSKWIQASCTVVHAFVDFMTTGAMALVLLSETSSMGLRAHTTALASATQSILGIITNIAIPYMVNPGEANLKGKVSFVFGGLAAPPRSDLDSLCRNSRDVQTARSTCCSQLVFRQREWALISWMNRMRDGANRGRSNTKLIDWVSCTLRL